MKTVTIDIDIDKVFREVYKTTAYAAVQRGDNKLVATADNENILTTYYAEGWVLLCGLLAHYSPTLEYENDDVSIPFPYSVEISMPDNWNGEDEDLKFLACEYMVNFVLLKWFGLTADGEKFAAAAKVATENIKVLLSKRKKPEYGK